MKKLLVGLVSMLLLMCFAGCGGGDPGDATEEKLSEEEAAPSSEGYIEDCYVAIKDCSFSTDYDGNKVIIINYEFGNEGEDATSFDTETLNTAYQDGVEIEKSFNMSLSEADENGTYDSELQSKKIKPGTTITVQEAYELANDTSDIEIEVTPLASYDEYYLTKTFKQQ